MIALEELINDAHRAIQMHTLLSAIIVGKHDAERLAAQTVLTKSADEFLPPHSARVCGIDVYEDPGLPPGNYELISDKQTLRRRLHLISIGCTVTPDGTIKPADWWQRPHPDKEPVG
jgi:hypothetical protein